MSKWIKKFLEKDPQNSTDNTDRFNSEPNMSVLSVPTQRVFDQNVEIMPLTRTDNTDRFNLEPNMSVLSVPTQGHFGKSPFALSNDSDLSDEYEERLAIAEYDGHQNSTQAQRIAYLDSFMAVLVTLPHDETKGDWLGQRVKAAKMWLLDQGIMQPK